MKDIVGLSQSQVARPGERPENAHHPLNVLQRAERRPQSRSPCSIAAAHWLRGIVDGILPDPSAVRIEIQEVGEIVSLIIMTPQHIYGRLVGRYGRTISCLRELAKNFSAVHRCTTHVQLQPTTEENHDHARSAERRPEGR